MEKYFLKKQVSKQEGVKQKNIQQIVSRVIVSAKIH